ncbi:hypothetical protein [Arthrobacter sp. B6]|uniref:hypothetical protein n=1 Tax=Arthrobacter sp. B6 TaxID=1570137 RepID=UPI00082B44FA|nr:hypothetical protein [Arthrobacter sp. B6]
MTQRIRRRTERLPWAWFAAATAGGIPVGLLWWLLAPGGLNLITRDPALGEGTNPDVWLPRDLTLAGLFVLAGCLLAVFVTDKSRRPRQEDLLLALTGSLAGAVVAWQVGMFASQLWGAPADTSLNASVAFSLRSLPVLLLWPAATAIGTFAFSLLTLLKHGPEGTAGSVAGGGAPGA